MAIIHLSIVLLILGLGHDPLVLRASARSVAPPKLCRPDHVFDSGTQKCLRLKHSISSLIKELIDNTDSALPFLHYSINGQNNTVNNGNNNNNNNNVTQVVQVSDLFVQNLAFLNEANMTDCIAMSACNEHCYSWPERNSEQKNYELSIIEKYFTVSETPKKKDDDDDDAPDFVRVIMQSSKKGIHFANMTGNEPNIPKLRSACLRCQNEYSNGCGPMNYAYTVRINALYRKLIENNVTFVDVAPKLPQNLSPEMLYYHYSMYFVQTANLTTCYALVSCENTCLLYQATIAEIGAESIEPPTNESTLLQGEPNKAEAIDIIHRAALKGYKFSTAGSCHQCRKEYPNCTEDKYEIAKASAAIFGN